MTALPDLIMQRLGQGPATTQQLRGFCIAHDHAPMYGDVSDACIALRHAGRIDGRQVDGAVVWSVLGAVLDAAEREARR